LFQHLVCFFLLSADTSFIPVHRTGFSDALLIKKCCGSFVLVEFNKKKGRDKKDDGDRKDLGGG
jgi:hypothetical protein